MAARPRREVFNPREPGFYHCMSRCVRRAHLCGTDRYTKKNYDHRRDWVEKRIRELARWFAIDLAFFAIMGNHIHLVLCNLPKLVDRWSDRTVIRRSCKIFPYKFQMLGVKNGKPTRDQLREFAEDVELVQELRLRLSDISWFMRQLKYFISCKANREEDKTGHFFEGRFRCVVITDKQGLLICGIYVDLNQIRAGEAATPWLSKRTSAFRRLKAQLARRRGVEKGATADGFLKPLSNSEHNRLDGLPPAGSFGSLRASDEGLFEMSSEMYFALLDWCGRRPAKGKAGKIPSSAESVLTALGIEPADLREAVDNFDEMFRVAVGSVGSLIEWTKSQGRNWLQGLTSRTSAGK